MDKRIRCQQRHHRLPEYRLAWHVGQDRICSQLLLGDWCVQVDHVGCVAIECDESGYPTWCWVRQSICRPRKAHSASALHPFHISSSPRPFITLLFSALSVTFLPSALFVTLLSSVRVVTSSAFLLRAREPPLSESKNEGKLHAGISQRGQSIGSPGHLYWMLLQDQQFWKRMYSPLTLIKLLASTWPCEAKMRLVGNSISTNSNSELTPVEKSTSAKLVNRFAIFAFCLEHFNGIGWSIRGPRQIFSVRLVSHKKHVRQICSRGSVSGCRGGSEGWRRCLIPSCSINILSRVLAMTRNLLAATPLFRFWRAWRGVER